MKTLADCLYETMKEYKVKQVDFGMIDVLEDVAKKSGCKITDNRLVHPRPRLNWIIHNVMKTKRGQELFEDHGYIHYTGIINRPCRVIKMREYI